MRSPFVALVALAVSAMVAVGCGGASDSSDGGGGASGASDAKSTVNLVAYSTPQVVYDELIPAFNKTAAGEAVGFKTSFGASGDQSRAVEGGQKADYVTFSTEPDMTRLVDAGLVDANWNQTPTKGLITTSLVSFVVRKGNPKNIKTWQDLLKPGVEVLTPNPFSSGAAKWNLLAGYGANGGLTDQAKGLDYLNELITKHVKIQDKSGRDALQNFTSGTGDVLLSYEYEAITAQKKGEKDIEFVTPDDTIKINIDAAVTKSAPPAAKSFLDYALSPEGQAKFAEWGYRPVEQSTLDANKDKFPDPPGLFTIEDLGGWDKVNEELFDVEGGKIAKIEEDAGVSTAK